MKAFKIENPNTGLFAESGVGNAWTKDGKAWSSLGRLKRHLAGKYDRTMYDGCVVHEVDFRTGVILSMPIGTFLGLCEQTKRSR